MYKRLIIVSIIMFISLGGLCALGLYSISLHRDGLQARRQADFTAVAEQIISIISSLYPLTKPKLSCVHPSATTSSTAWLMAISR